MINEYRPLAEFLYFICQCLLLLVAILGLRQISIAKRDIRVRSEREARVIAAQRSEELVDRLAKPAGMIDAIRSSESIPTLNTKPNSFVAEKLSPELKAHCAAWRSVAEKHPKFLWNAQVILRNMEAYSIYFVTGQDGELEGTIADDRIGFRLVGPLFCELVELLFPLLVREKSEVATGGGYQLTMELYNRWRDRLTKNALHHELTETLRRFDEIKLSPLKAIGTE